MIKTIRSLSNLQLLLYTTLITALIHVLMASSLQSAKRPSDILTSDLSHISDTSTSDSTPLPTAAIGATQPILTPLEVAKVAAPSRATRKWATELRISSGTPSASNPYNMGRFIITRKFLSSSSSQTFLGLDLYTHWPVAIKLEPRSSVNALLEREYDLSQSLGNFIPYYVKSRRLQISSYINVPQSMTDILSLLDAADSTKTLLPKPTPGFPLVYGYGKIGLYNVMVRELLGPNLERLLALMNRPFSAKTTLMLGYQIIKLLQVLHGNGFIHGNITPGILVLGRANSKNQLHLIDCDLATKYRDIQGKIRPYSENHPFRGSPRYASKWTHAGIRQSPRDDLLAAAYSLIYLYFGFLPWQNHELSDLQPQLALFAPLSTTSAAAKLTFKDNIERIMRLKHLYLPDHFAAMGCPHSIVELLRYTNQLEYGQKIAYSRLLSLFRNELSTSGYTVNIHTPLDFQYDWETAPIIYDGTCTRHAIIRKSPTPSTPSLELLRDHPTIKYLTSGSANLLKHATAERSARRQLIFYRLYRIMFGGYRPLKRDIRTARQPAQDKTRDRKLDFPTRFSLPARRLVASAEEQMKSSDWADLIPVSRSRDLRLLGIAFHKRFATKWFWKPKQYPCPTVDGTVSYTPANITIPHPPIMPYLVMFLSDNIWLSHRNIVISPTLITMLQAEKPFHRIIE